MAASDENQPREHTAIYVWDKAIWFAPHGHDPAEPPDEWTRRRLGDYENDYEKPEAQDSTKKCFMIAKKIRVNFEIDPLSGDKYGCMSCDPTVGWPVGNCPTQKKCPQTEEDASQPVQKSLARAPEGRHGVPRARLRRGGPRRGALPRVRRPRWRLRARPRAARARRRRGRRRRPPRRRRRALCAPRPRRAAHPLRALRARAQRGRATPDAGALGHAPRRRRRRRARRRRDVATAEVMTSTPSK